MTIGKLLLISLASLFSTPAMGQWIDVTSNIESILEGKSTYSPVYLQAGSVKNIKSVNFKSTVYRRAVFSYSIARSTYRQTYLFDCKEANYKTSDTQPGYWTDINWITPTTSKTLFDWAAYKYLCPNSKDPWLAIAENIDDERYLVNTEAGYTFTSPVYGKVRTWVMIKIKKESPPASASGRFESSWPREQFEYPDLMQVYVSCQKRLMSIYKLDGPADKEATLDDPNPGSIAEGIVKAVCAK